ncbi:GHMP kinase [Mucilaginibacter sp. PPCGB 2223]|uniref:mevalonate kinase family protein n=1 Tax=Mucilaginibacter sp. PPCGB 2223 TaxID=1886027 RepID=UPI00082685E1|nr:GHMP kinase [Mucilaginibacter sp. PPCGB 2223]OCX52346.1 GHMP kinase [Mucilaginibacter sp. PPCGB 2223]
MIIDSRAYARAGLLGNPSDGYFGKTISLSIKNFGAHILLYQSPELVIEQQEADANSFRNIYHLKETVGSIGYNGGIPIIKAAIKKFCDYCDENSIRLANKNFTIRYRSTIPRQVGLAGSSAIIIATLKALMQFYKVDIPLHLLANIALAAEAQEMGINAGLQDRVIQCYEGCVHMDFNKAQMEKHGYGVYTPIDPTLLPKLYMAYKTNLSKVSGKVLNEIRAKYDKGDKHTIDTLTTIANLADEGAIAIKNKDYGLLGELINANFDNRCKIMTISESNMQLINTARGCGATASFTGSGGAIIGTYQDEEMLKKLIYSLKKINARVIKPYMI